MNWELITHKSVGPIEFGMRRSHAREVLSAFANERKNGSLSENAMPSDLYQEFEVQFSKYDKCAAVRITPSIPVSFDGMILFESTWDDLKIRMQEKDKAVEVRPDEMISHKLGILAKKDAKSESISEILCFEADHFYAYKEIPLPSVATSMFVQVGFVEDVDFENKQFTTLEDGAKSLFQNMREKGVVLWNNIPVPFDYVLDLPDLLLGLVPILREMHWADQGDQVLSVATNNLDFGWRVVWDEDVVNIRSEWRKVPGGLQNVLSSEPLDKVYVSKADFMSEWKMLLEQFERAFKATGSSFSDPDAQDVVLEVQNLNKFIKNFGKLYPNMDNDLIKATKNKNASLQFLMATTLLIIVSFGIYWVVTRNQERPFAWIQNNWILLSIIAAALFALTIPLTFLVRRNRTK